MPREQFVSFQEFGQIREPVERDASIHVCGFFNEGENVIPSTLVLRKHSLSLVPHFDLRIRASFGEPIGADHGPNRGRGSGGNCYGDGFGYWSLSKRSHRPDRRVPAT